VRRRLAQPERTDIRLSAGEHTFTILPVKTGFRVDRIYLTMGEELPPGDREWDEAVG